MKVSHFIVGLVLLIVGLVIGLVRRTPVRAPFEAEGTNAILVGPAAADVSISTNYLWQDATHSDVVVWVALDPKATLLIDFHEEIFDGMTRQPNGLYRAQCAGSRCDSGHIKQGVKHGLPGFKYDQTLVLPNGKTDHADGRIIIKP